MHSVKHPGPNGANIEQQPVGAHGCLVRESTVHRTVETMVDIEGPHHSAISARQGQVALGIGAKEEFVVGEDDRRGGARADGGGPLDLSRRCLSTGRLVMMIRIGVGRRTDDNLELFHLGVLKQGHTSSEKTFPSVLLTYR